MIYCTVLYYYYVLVSQSSKVNHIKDTSLLVYCLTMFDVCHMFVL